MAGITMTNTASLWALQSMHKTEREFQTVMDRVSTGKKVNKPSDDGAAWAVAASMRSSVGAWGAVRQSLTAATGATAVASAATTSMRSQLMEARIQIMGAMGGTAAPASVAGMLAKLPDQIGRMVENASYNGTNLLVGAKDMSVLSNIEGGQVKIEGYDLNATTLGVDALAIDQTSLDKIDAALKTLDGANAAFGTGQNSLEARAKFSTSMMDSLTKATGAIEDADMGQEAMRLNQLQVRRQLANQVLSMVNSQHASMLSSILPRSA